MRTELVQLVQDVMPPDWLAERLSGGRYPACGPPVDVAGRTGAALNLQGQGLVLLPPVFFGAVSPP